MRVASSWLLPAILAIAVGCAPEGPPETPATPEPPPERDASAIPHPPLEGMEPAVARVLEAQRSRVEALLDHDATPSAELALAIGRLGQLYQAHRLVEVAEACYREAHALDPESFDWAYYLGVLSARRGHLDAAVAAFREALELRPDDLPALVRLADLELDRGEIDAAHALYRRATSLDPSLAAAEYGLGRVAAERRDFEQAIEHFDRALELEPRASVIHYHLGQAYRRQGELDRAGVHLEQSGPVKVAIPDPLMSRVNALASGASPYLIQGNTALRDGRLSVAADAFRRATEADPDNAKARQSLATVLTLLRDVDGALEQLEAAARLAPGNAQAQSELGAALAEAGRDERALEHLRRAVELDSGHQKARLNLANTLARLGRFEAAASHYRRLLEIDPLVIPTNAFELEMWLAAEPYLEWPAESAIHGSTGPHFGNVRTWLHPDLFDSLEAGVPTNPANTGTVKELYGDGMARRGWSVSVKTQEDSAGGDGWYWYELFDGAVLADAQGLGVCTGCHGGGVDYVLTPFPLQ